MVLLSTLSSNKGGYQTAGGSEANQRSIELVGSSGGKSTGAAKPTALAELAAGKEAKEYEDKVSEDKFSDCGR